MRYLAALLAIFLGLAVVAYQTVNRQLTELSIDTLPQLGALASEYGLEVEEIKLGTAKIGLPRKILWQSVRTKFKLKGFSGIRSNEPFSFSADSIALSLTNFANGEFQLELLGAELRTLDSPKNHTEQNTYVSEDISSGAVVIQSASLPLTLGPLSKESLKDPRELFYKLKATAKTLHEALRGGFLPPGLELSGVVEFSLRNTLYDAKIESRRVQDKNFIKLNQEDLQRAARSFRTKLTEPEVHLISQYPLRTPELLQIKHRAELEAQLKFSEGGASPDQSKDAYQYILWSYLLSKRFGAEFAKQVTDAHEAGIPGQSAAERSMDLANGSIGREYANRNIPFERIYDTMAADTRVVRTY